MSIALLLAAISFILNILFVYLFVRSKKRILLLSESFQKVKNTMIFFNDLAHLGVKYSKDKKERLRKFLETIKRFSDCELSGLCPLWWREFFYNFARDFN